MKRNVAVALFLIAVGIIFGALLVTNLDGVKLGGAQDRPTRLGIQKPALQPSPELKAFNDALVSVAKDVTPAVVSIVVTTKARKSPQEFFFFPDFKFKGPEEEQSQGAGSGVIVTKTGYIITNNHVVQDAADNGIEVVLNDTRRFKAKLIGTDPLTDVAVIQIAGDDLPTASLGNSDEILVGQWVVAIGNPLGLNSTVTAGIVSYLGRNIRIITDSYGVENFIQTDAAINPGNSGGPLANIYGQVVGINTAIASNNARYQGYGFAIPINLARTVAEDLIAHGKVIRGYIGVQITEVDETMAKANGLDKAEGVLVQDLVEGGAAQDAGIKEGDIILSIDGKAVKAPNELQSYVAGKHPGEKVALSIWRDGKKVEKIVKLKSRTDDKSIAENTGDEGSSDEGSSTEVSSKPVQFDKLGFTVSRSDSRTMRDRKVESEVIVSNVKNFSEAANRGLRVGDIIVEADKKEIKKISDFDKIVKSKKAGESLMLRIKDQAGTKRFIAMEIQKD